VKAKSVAQVTAVVVAAAAVAAAAMERVVAVEAGSPALRLPRSRREVLSFLCELWLALPLLDHATSGRAATSERPNGVKTRLAKTARLVHDQC